MYHQSVVVYFDGTIGVGKSYIIDEVAKIMARTRRVHCFYENVNNWVDTGILERFYADPAEYAFDMQMQASMSRVNNMRKIHAIIAGSSPDDPAVILVERSWLGDLGFAKLQEIKHNITPRNMAIYDTMWKAFDELEIDLFQRIAHTVHINLVDSPAACHQRMVSRGRGAEHGVPEQYIAEYANVFTQQFMHAKKTKEDVLHARYETVPRTIDTSVDAARVVAMIGEVM